MVSKSVCVSVRGALKYFEVHLNVADYFVESEKVDRASSSAKWLSGWDWRKRRSRGRSLPPLLSAT